MKDKLYEIVEGDGNEFYEKFGEIYPIVSHGGLGVDGYIHKVNDIDVFINEKGKMNILGDVRKVKRNIENKTGYKLRKCQ